jgi:4-hydroxybenzoate polyprenyltransferase
MPSDIKIEHLIFAKTPAWLHPYIKLARLDRPTGTWLLLFPCWWGILLAGQGFFNLGGAGWLRLLVLFPLGALLMRSAGCVINDLWDRDLDAQVERTKTRPLPSGEITREQAMYFLAELLGPALLILLTLSKTAIFLGVFSLLLVAVYPLMKRITWWPQAFLGLTFNWGALMGWAAQKNSLAVPALLLYMAGFFWTLAYDTIYAHQDKEDDARIGIKSTALFLGKGSRAAVAAFFALSIVLLFAAKCLAFPSFMTPLLLIPLSIHAWMQVKHWNPDDPESCLEAFRSNRVFGALAVVMLAL